MPHPVESMYLIYSSQLFDTLCIFLLVLSKFLFKFSLFARV